MSNSSTSKHPLKKSPSFQEIVEQIFQNQSQKNHQRELEQLLNESLDSYKSSFKPTISTKNKKLLKYLKDLENYQTSNSEDLIKPSLLPNDRKELEINQIVTNNKFIFYDIEVLPFDWTYTFAKWSTKGLEYKQIVNNIEELKEYFRQNYDYCFVGWNSKNYDSKMDSVILQGKNPFIINQFIIPFQSEFKKHLREQYPKWYVRRTPGGKIAFVTDLNIKDVKINPNVSYQSKYRVADGIAINFRQGVLKLFKEWFIREHKWYIEQKYGHLTPSDLDTLLTNQFDFKPIWENLIGKKQPWYLDLLDKITGDDGNKGLKYFSGLTGTSIEEFDFDVKQVVESAQMEKLLEYNLVDVLQLAHKAHKEQVWMRWEFQKVLFVLAIVRQIKGSVELKERYLAKINQKKVIKATEENIESFFKKNWPNYDFEVGKEYRFDKELSDIVSLDDFPITNARLVGRFLTWGNETNDKEKKELDKININLPESIDVLIEELKGTTLGDRFKQIVDIYRDPKTQGMTFKEYESHIKSSSQYLRGLTFDEFGDNLKFDLGIGGQHSAIPNYFFKGKIALSDVVQMYPSLIIHYKLFSDRIPLELFKFFIENRAKVKPGIKVGKFLKSLETIKDIRVENDDCYVNGELVSPSYVDIVNVISTWDEINNNPFKGIEINSTFDLVKYLKVNYEVAELMFNEIQNLSDGYKLISNTTFGAMNDKFNPLYSPNTLVHTTIIGQLLLLGLVFMLAGKVKMIQTNTDGIVYEVLDPYTNEDIGQIITKWEQISGLKMETEEVDGIVQSDVNNYFLINKGKVTKGKGKFNNYGSWMTLTGGSLKDNRIPIVERAVVDFFLGKNIYDTFNEALEQKRFLEFAIISSKGKSYQKVIWRKGDKTKETNLKFYRGFAVKNGWTLRKLSADGREVKLTDFPESVEVVNGDMLDWQELPFELDLAYYENLVKKMTIDFRDSQMSLKEKKYIYNVMKKYLDEYTIKFHEIWKNWEQEVKDNEKMDLKENGKQIDLFTS